MSSLGSGANGELTFIDILAIVSFCVGLQNLDLNLAQEDLDNQTQELDRRLRDVVDNIHQHLQEQDKKLDYVISQLDTLQQKTNNE